MRTLRQRNWLFFILLTFLLNRCTGIRIITSAHRKPTILTNETSLSTISDTSESVDSSDQIDFGTVFFNPIAIEMPATDSACDSPHQKETVLPDSSHFERKPIAQYRYPAFPLVSNKVRVALQKKVSIITLYTVGLVTVHSSSLVGNPFRGKVTIQKGSASRVKIIVGDRSQEITLPCTLLSSNSYNFMEFDGKSYRGAMIVAQDITDGFVLINYLNVEDYLRGVIPLEIGYRLESEIEALKAQAIAARTYTYRRIKERKAFSYDLTNSVADQVYGGADVEYRESDIAVKMTKDLILTYKNSLVYAYYHSTCGGKTASVNNVWNKPSSDYLVSINDTDSAGRAYCSISPIFTWQERWTKNQFESIVYKNLSGNTTNVHGILKTDHMSISIKDTNLCGRVKTLLVRGNSWQREILGDRTRYVLRRNRTDQPILRSANFTILAYDNKGVVINGRGYGHGVGMCQMGAIARSRQGQPFDTILKAYYTGVTISQGVFSDI